MSERAFIPASCEDARRQFAEAVPELNAALDPRTNSMIEDGDPPTYLFRALFIDVICPLLRTYFTDGVDTSFLETIAEYGLAKEDVDVGPLVDRLYELLELWSLSPDHEGVISILWTDLLEGGAGQIRSDKEEMGEGRTGEWVSAEEVVARGGMYLQWRFEAGAGAKFDGMIK